MQRSRAGVPWPSPRFEPAGETFIDLLTGLAWWHDANPAEFPLSWSGAFEFFIAQMNQTGWGGHPVRGRSVKLPVTGQHRCYATDGKARACVGTGQDGDPIGCCMAVNAFCDGAEGVSTH